MSYWGAQVIVSLFGAIPGIGASLVEWIRGRLRPSRRLRLNRFLSHCMWSALPLLLVFLVVAHILALHEVGSNNPDGGRHQENKRSRMAPPSTAFPFIHTTTAKDMVRAWASF